MSPNVKPRKDPPSTAAKAEAFTILEYSNMHMIHLHYNVIKRHFEPAKVLLLMAGTDALVYKLKCQHDAVRDFCHANLAL